MEKQQAQYMEWCCQANIEVRQEKQYPAVLVIDQLNAQILVL